MNDIQLRIEGGLRAIHIAILDRAFPDGLARCRVAGLNPNEILAECFLHRYASVFMLDRLPLQPDGVRAEDDAPSDYLDEWLARDYAALGYDVVRVLVLSIKERLEFFLDRLFEQGLILQLDGADWQPLCFCAAILFVRRVYCPLCRNHW